MKIIIIFMFMTLNGKTDNLPLEYKHNKWTEVAKNAGEKTDEKVFGKSIEEYVEEHNQKITAIINNK